MAQKQAAGGDIFSQSPSELAKIAVILEDCDALENDAGEIMLAIHARPGGDERLAELFCDGGRHAILTKGPGSLMVCAYLHPQVREKLPLRKTILCYEDPNPVQEQAAYLARVVKRAGTTELAQAVLQSAVRAQSQNEL